MASLWDKYDSDNTYDEYLGEDNKLRNHILQSHTLAENAGLIAKCAKVKCLALNHFVPDGFAEFNDEDWLKAVRRHWSGKTILGRDGIRIPL